MKKWKRYILASDIKILSRVHQIAFLIVSLKNGQEKDIVEKRVERMQRKVEGSPNVETMLVAVRELRKEREKVKELQTQKTEQRTAIGKISPVRNMLQVIIVELVIIIKILFRFLVHADQRIARLEQQLKDLRSAAVGATPEGLLQVRYTFTTSNSNIDFKIRDSCRISILIQINSTSVTAY